MKKKQKTIYLSLAAEIMSDAHLKLIKKAQSYGNVIIGLLTDKAVSEYRSLPLIDYNQRYEILKKVKGIYKVIKQDTWDFTFNLKKIKPEYVIHGDDWKFGIQKKIRLKILKTIKAWNGKLIEVPYTKNDKVSLVHDKIKSHYFNNESRVSRLKRLIEAKPIVRALESHNSLTGLIIENMNFIKKNKFYEFDAMWSSSLTDSAVRGKPDNQSVDYSTRINALNEILDVTNKPVIFDADNGGRIEHLPFLVRSLERSGVSAIVLEDKIGLKKNSLFKNQKGVNQDSIRDFSKKIKTCNSSKLSKDFFVVARIESLILGKPVSEALKRAFAYTKAGANAILIHSKENNPRKIFEFAKSYKKKCSLPLIAVPSTYSKTRESELIKNGFNIVIYANHLLRAAYPAMNSIAKSILTNGRSSDIEKKIVPIKEIISLL